MSKTTIAPVLTAYVLSDPLANRERQAEAERELRALKAVARALKRIEAEYEETAQAGNWAPPRQDSSMAQTKRALARLSRGSPRRRTP